MIMAKSQKKKKEKGSKVEFLSFPWGFELDP